MRERLFTTHPLHPEVTKALAILGDLRIASAPTRKCIAAESEGAAIVVVRAPIPEAVLRPRLRALVRHGAGLDMIPVGAATAMGVLVANVPGANALTVAEHALWSAMALLRRHPAVSVDLRTRGWAAARAHADEGRELSGRILGIVGMGAVGTTLARIAVAGFGMQVLAVTKRTDLAPGVNAVPLADMLRRADIVVLACPLTDATRGLLGPAELALLRPHAVLVNVARGPVVDEAALVRALRERRLAGAALDVFETQPLRAGHPLLDVPNVILTPHMAGITEESMLRMGMGVVAEVRAILEGGRPVSFCNPEVWDRYRARFPAG